jgi:DNA-binding transcriptional ArsR family regulator
MDTNQALHALDALGQPSRLAIFRRLVQAGPDGLSVGDLRAALDLPAATLSNHLNILRQAGLVLDRREGRSIVCRADYARMNELVGYLTENCCAGSDCGVPAGARPPRPPC